MKLTDINKTIFDHGSVIAEIYKNSHLLFKTMIKPFKEEMKTANNIILFVDNEYNITGGQIGVYTREKGLNTILF
jgi:hypothetical protein